MSKALFYCIIAALIVLGIFLYFLIGMWANASRKRLQMIQDTPFAWMKLVVLIDGTLELLGFGLYDRLFLNLTQSEEAAAQREACLSSWIFKGIIIGLIVLVVLLHIILNRHVLGTATLYLLLHLVLDPIALITPKDSLKELSKDHINAMAEVQFRSEQQPR